MSWGSSGWWGWETPDDGYTGHTLALRSLWDLCHGRGRQVWTEDPWPRGEGKGGAQHARRAHFCGPLAPACHPHSAWRPSFQETNITSEGWHTDPQTGHRKVGKGSPLLGPEAARTLGCTHQGLAREGVSAWLWLSANLLWSRSFGFQFTCWYKRGPGGPMRD